ncbi:MAG TPA: ABC transporter substrate-binding protein [Streptosporangiaceae bacterium]|jgi:peptide/nickel transport system substrate-binding protein
MTEHKRGLLSLTAGLGSLAMGLTACGGVGSAGGTEEGRPQTGGTLEIIGSGGVDHLDPASAYATYSSSLERAWTRQLFGFPASDDQAAGSRVQADVATRVPTGRNGGISPDGKTYTINLRRGVMWSTTPAREVVAGDFIRGIKRLCNPNPNGTGGNKAYYTDTIAGFRAFCAGYTKVKADDPKAMADYQNTHDVAGMRTVDDHTLVFTLIRPAADFPSILAMEFASPAPKEYDQYVPDSDDFRRHTLSSGPYKIVRYDPKTGITLDRNPNWRAETDPLRKAYVDRIQLQQGQDSPVAAEQQIEAGTADLIWDHVVPTAAIARLKAAHDKRLGIFATANTNPHLRFNFDSPNNLGALRNLKIRQAIEYAINKEALAKIYGGASLNTPLTTVIPPGSTGYRASDLYRTPNFQGDVAKCKTLLAAGMREVGIGALTLNYVYRTSSNHPKVTQSVADNLEACGIQTRLQPTSQDDFYGKFLANPQNSEEGKWDIAAPGWNADWPGVNGRSIVQPLFDGTTCGPNSINYGCFQNTRVDQLIDRALAAKTPGAAAGLWAQADREIMKDAGFVPFLQQLTPLTHSSRVHNALFLQKAQLFDYTNIWLSK